MARRTPVVTSPEPVKVHCCHCRRFVRDTAGRSFNIDTGEFFMGTCTMGHTDSGIKLFADKARVCDDYCQQLFE